MKATWTMKAGLSVIGQHTPGNPRHWTVSAWAALPDGTKERVTVRPKGKCTLYDLIPAISGGVAVQLDCVVIWHILRILYD